MINRYECLSLWREVNWGLVVIKFCFIYDKACGIFFGYLMYVFHEFLTSQGDILNFTRASSECLCLAPQTRLVTVTRG